MVDERRTTTYLLYARKSSESDDRQIQSIDDQVSRLRQLASELGLTITEVFTEAKSAKKPGNRPVFDEVLRKIENSKANGILCWQINRLSRNPIDSGRLSWLLQQGILQSIQTIDRQYLPDDNVLLFNVETGTANQFIIDLKKNVKRGMESKVKRGWAPSMAPLGYLNDKLEKKIIKDPERFTLVRKMWDLMLTGGYTPPQILKIATSDWGFRTRTWHKKDYGGNPVAYSSIYKLFTNPFYAGLIEYGGIRYPGKHEAMITLDEFERVQTLLTKKGSCRPKGKTFTYSGLIRCAECGCSYTALLKQKILKRSHVAKQYTYYYCTRRTKKVVCNQKKVITEECLEALFQKELAKYQIAPEFLDWALSKLALKTVGERETTEDLKKTQKTALTQAQTELDELITMRRRKLIDDETFVREHNKLNDLILKLNNQLNETKLRQEKWIELTKQTFLFAAYALNTFTNGGLELKKEILHGLCETLKIKDGNLIITPYEWLVPIQKVYPGLWQELRRLEPQMSTANIDRNEAFESIRTRWYTTIEDVRKTFERLNDDSIYIPKLFVGNSGLQSV